MDRKSFRGNATVKAATQGVAEIVVSAFGNVDHNGDIIVKGAVSRQLAGEYGPVRPKGLLDHHFAMASAVAKTLNWWEADDGLHIEAQYNLNKTIGREAFSDLEFYGDDMEFSIGLWIKSTREPTDQERTAGCQRVITEMEIDEWSHVVLGANSETRLVSAKSRRKVLETAAADQAAKALAGSMEERSDALRDALREVVPAEWLWIRGTFADHVVVERETHSANGEYATDFVSIDYTETDGEFEFGVPVEVDISEVATPKTLMSIVPPIGDFVNWRAVAAKFAYVTAL